MEQQNQNSAPQPTSELEALKTEIASKMENKAEKTSLPWGSLAITALLGVLAIVSLAQMTQTVLIFNKIKSGELKANAATAPTSLDSQPDMVGGC